MENANKEVSEENSLLKELEEKYAPLFKIVGIDGSNLSFIIREYEEEAQKKGLIDDAYFIHILNGLNDELRDNIERSNDRSKVLDDILKNTGPKVSKDPVGVIKYFDDLLNMIRFAEDNRQIAATTMSKEGTLYKALEVVYKENEDIVGKREAEEKFGKNVVVYLNLYHTIYKQSSYGLDIIELANRYLEEYNNYPVLSSAKENELIREYRRGEKESKEELMKSSFRYVVEIADEISEWGFDRKNLIYIGTSKLNAAFSYYDQSLSMSWATFAKYYIRGQLKKSLEIKCKQAQLPSETEKSKSIIETAITILKQDQKRNPTLDEVASRIGYSKEKVKFILSFSDMSSSVIMPQGETDFESMILERIVSISNIPKDNDLSDLVNSLLRNMQSIDETGIRMFIDYRGLEDGILKSIEDLRIKYRMNKVDIQNRLKEMQARISNDIVARGLYSEIMSKRDMFLKKVQEKHKPVIEKARISIKGTSDFILQDADKYMIALLNGFYESEKISISEVAICCQRPVSVIEERMKEIEKYYIIGDSKVEPKGETRKPINYQHTILLSDTLPQRETVIRTSTIHYPSYTSSNSGTKPKVVPVAQASPVPKPVVVQPTVIPKKATQPIVEQSRADIKPEKKEEPIKGNIGKSEEKKMNRKNMFWDRFVVDGKPLTQEQKDSIIESLKNHADRKGNINYDFITRLYGENIDQELNQQLSNQDHSLLNNIIYREKVQMGLVRSKETGGTPVKIRVRPNIQSVSKQKTKMNHGSMDAKIVTELQIEKVASTTTTTKESFTAALDKISSLSISSYINENYGLFESFVIKAILGIETPDNQKYSPEHISSEFNTDVDRVKDIWNDFLDKFRGYVSTNLDALLIPGVRQTTSAVKPQKRELLPGGTGKQSTT